MTTLETLSCTRRVEIAVVLCDGDLTGAKDRLLRLLDFLGIPGRAVSDPEAAGAKFGELPCGKDGYVVLAPLPLLGRDLKLARDSKVGLPALWRAAEAVYLYATDDLGACSEALRLLTGSDTARLVPVEAPQMRVRVSRNLAEVSGPLAGLEEVVRLRPQESVFLVEDGKRKIERILDSNEGLIFCCLETSGLRLFISSSREFPDVAAHTEDRWFDVRDNFCASVPLVMFLKWACRAVGWQSQETGACLIIDDPVLKPRYGYCDFGMIDLMMQKLRFTMNIAFIPWNWRRTSKQVASLIRDSGGRYSLSVHGCDHTGAEFGTRSIAFLNAKMALAKQRMESHQHRTGTPHDWVMVFPQGQFSAEALRVLQQHQFIAAVNSEVLAVNCDCERPTIGDLWSVAILNYSSFPLFTRRYPSHGMLNFAFDLLLGKPCLVVEHHEFFKAGGRRAIEFIEALNSLNVSLSWRELGEVIRRAYQWRRDSSGRINVRMFGNELVLRNEEDMRQEYLIEKPDRSSAGVQRVLMNNSSVAWVREGECIRFTCTVDPGREANVKVEYAHLPQAVMHRAGLGAEIKVAARRFLSELRDNVVVRHERMYRFAQWTQRLVNRRSPR